MWRLRLAALSAVLCVCVGQGPPGAAPNAPHRRFEYKYSFKPPYLAQKDGTVPFFDYSGSE